jgi:hypothetical protein
MLVITGKNERKWAIGFKFGGAASFSYCAVSGGEILRPPGGSVLKNIVLRYKEI